MNQSIWILAVLVLACWAAISEASAAAFVAAPALRATPRKAASVSTSLRMLDPYEAAEREPQTITLSRTVDVSQQKTWENQDLFSAIFGESKMPDTAKNLADMIMTAYAGTETEAPAPFSAEQFVTALKKLSVNQKKPAPRLSPGSRQLCRAIIRSCEPRHTDRRP